MRLIKAIITVLFLGTLLFIPQKSVFASVSSCKYYVLDPWDPYDVGISSSSNLPISVAFGRASATNYITNINITQDQGNTIGTTDNGFADFITSKTYDANGVYIVAKPSLNSYLTGTNEATAILNTNFLETTMFHVQMSANGGSTYTSCTRRDDVSSGSAPHIYLLNADSIANQAPIINAIPDTNIIEGNSYVDNGSFSDGDSVSWTATVN